ncbi:unnamed protein product [Notodromas monacha]|uniref:RUN domain-containing protein n=1 Tax=Notodromas monacha TaxID=399045 RepID=A0A7R9G8M4_9CRUS|nr:unnamed protein product [Notodromas monacha]CAG0913428.1 unnamed protein product [Notodromas monacha]
MACEENQEPWEADFSNEESFRQCVDNLLDCGDGALDNRHSSMSNESLPLERMAPLGASATDTEDFPDCVESIFEEKADQLLKESRLQVLEEEQEQLISSLVQLTTHFAQVQFRLQQITEAPDNLKQDLLKELEEFASRGIPDVRGLLKDTIRENLVMKEKSLKAMQRLLDFLHIFAAGQFGCAADPFRKNILKQTAAGNHWGDKRAALQLSIEKLSKYAERCKRRAAETAGYNSDADEALTTLNSELLVSAVRKSFAPALRDLMHHGLMKHFTPSTALVPWTGCFSRRSIKVQPQVLHAWDLLLAYYDIKRGPSYNATPQRKLSESFGLDIVGGKAVTTKQTLLSAIGKVIASHTPLKRSPDAHFKAFICEALKKLACNSRKFYVLVGFEDALRAMEKLQGYDFDLPVDFAIQQLRNIKDAF